MTKAKKMTSAFIAAAAALICALFFMMPMTAFAEDCIHTDSNSDGFCDNGCGAYNFNCGTYDWDTYTPITTAEELQAINDDLSGNYVLMNDIDLDGVTWTPIGNDTTYFTGKFSGNGNVIKNLTITAANGAQGLFGYNSGTIINLGIENGSISGYTAGGVCAENYGTINGCYNNADVSGKNAGGICGNNYGTISNCYNTGDIIGTYSYSNVGGICGYVAKDCSVEYCYNTGAITAEDNNSSIGSIAGLTYYDPPTNCYYLEGTATYCCHTSEDGGQATLHTNGVKTLAELCTLDIDGENGTVWSAGAVTEGTADGNLRTDKLTLPYLTVFGADSAPEGGTVDKFDFGYNGSEDWQEYTPITTATELQAINDDLDGNYVLMNDIDLDGEEWTPIGDNSYSPNAFTGKFSGNGNVIKNISVTDAYCAGLFAENDGLIMNLGIASGSISGTYAGGICTYNNGTIFGCYNNADITGSYQFAGGICNTNYGTIDNCLNSGSVTNTKVDASLTNAAGGIVGNNFSYSIISNCVNMGNVSAEDEANAIIGDDDAHGEYITNCYYLDTTAEHALYYSEYVTSVYSDSGKMTLAELCALDIDGNGAVWSAGSASFTAEDVTVDENDERMGTASVKLPYLTVFGENAQQTAELDLYNFSLTDTPDWQTYTPITTAAELQAIEDDLDGNYVLMNDIDLANVEWTPIGNNTTYFTGKFSGNGKVVKNLTIPTQGNYIGLFNVNRGLIMNLGVEGTVTSSGGYYGGGIVGLNYGTISGCYFKGDVSAQSQQGGIVGWNAQEGIVDNCFAIGSVTGSGNYAGGIVGFNDGRVSDCYCASTVTLTGEYTDKGGVCGTNVGTITNCIYNKDIYTDEDNTEGVDGLLTLDMTAGNALYTFCFDSDVWGYKAVDKDNCIAYYPYLKAFGEESAASVSYETKFSIEYDEDKGTPVYGEDLHFIISALVKFDGMEKFAPAVDSYADGEGSFRLTWGDVAITEYFPIYDCAVLEMKTEFPVQNISVGEQTIWLEYIADDSDFFCDLSVSCTITVAKAVIDSVTIEIDAPQPEVALDMEPVVTPEGMYYELVWSNDNNNVNYTDGEYGNTYRAFFRIWPDDNHAFADTVTVTAPTEDFEVELDSDLYVEIYFPTLPKGTMPVVTATPGNGEIQLEWEAIEGADLYRVRRNDGSGWVNYADVQNTVYTDTDVENGKEYKYAVYARINGEWSKASNIVGVAPVGEVTITAAEAYGDSIELEWTAISNAESYRIRRNDGSGWVNYQDLTDTLYTDTDVTAGKSYRYAVYAKVDGAWSKASNIVTVVVKPAAAENITTTAVNDGVLIEWDEVAGAELYRIRRNDGSGWVNYKDITDASYTDTDVTAGKYYYAVYARVNGAWSEASEVVTIVVKLTAAENVTAVATGDGVLIEWDEVAGAELYRIRRNDGSGWENYKDLTDTSYTDTEVTAGKYYYAVYARVNGAWSEASEIVTIVVKLTAAENVTAVATGDGVLVEWDEVAGAELYRIRRNDGSGWVNYKDLTDTSYIDTEVTAGKYYYAVYVRANGVWSDASDITSVTI